ncbi:MAG: amidohydrolase family protein [Chloroflexota bacterium]
MTETSPAVAAEPARYDLVITGGEVLDPSQGLRGHLDLAIHRGKVAAVAPRIPAERAVQTISVAGRLVVPGLVDLHAHVYPRFNVIGTLPDQLAPLNGSTTLVSAGDVGHNGFAMLRQWVIGQARTRVFAFVHISLIGLIGSPIGEMLNLAYGDVEAAARIAAEHQDVVIGIKVRQSRRIVGENGLEPLRRAIAAAEASGTDARVMCHIGDVPGDLSDLLDLLRPGDILTHAYTGGNGVVQNGALLAAAREAKARGVVIDVGNGGGGFDYTICEPALEQGLLPDTISSDIHPRNMYRPGRPYLPWVMSEFLHLGFSLEQVVAMATINPARIINRVPGLGTLQVGAPGDVTLLELVEGPVTFVDGQGNRRAGSRVLRPVGLVIGGYPHGFPPPLGEAFP